MRKKIFFSLVVLVLVVLPLYAACATTPTTTTTPTHTTPPTTTTTPTPTTPIKVGFPMAFTGTGAAGADYCRKGFELAMEEAGYKAAGREIQVIYEDTEGNAEVGLTKVRKLVELDGVRILVGPWFENVAIATQNYIGPLGTVVYINAMGSSLRRSCDYPNSINLWFTEENITVPFAQYAYDKLGYRTCVLAGSDYNWGHQTTETFAEAFTRAGGTVLDKIWVPFGTADFAPYLTAVKPYKGQADFFWEFLAGSDGARFFKEWKDFGVEVPVFTSGCGLGDLLEVAGPSAVGALGGYHWIPELDYSTTQTFVAKYQAEYGVVPNSWAPRGYNAGKVLVKVIEDVNGNVEDTPALFEALNSVRLDDNIVSSEPFTIDPLYHSANLSCYIYEVIDVNGQPAHQIIEKLPGTYGPKLLENWTAPTE